MKKLFKLLQCLALGAVIFSSPIIMEHAEDIYLEEIASPKAMPVKIGSRTVASSFQIKWKGKRVTVTNNHVCSIVKEAAERDAQRSFISRVKAIKTLGLPKDMENSLITLLESNYKQQKFSVVGKTLKIGEVNRKILYNSPNHDICFLEPVGDKYFNLASSVHRGERITIIGHPRGVPQSIADGRIVGEETYLFPWISEAGKVRYLRSTALTYPGNSGSPVINRYGNVVGILFAGLSVNTINLNCIVPLDYIKTELLTYFNKK